MDQMLGRAMRAYFMAAAKEGYRADQPSAAGSGQMEEDGKRYVVLRNVNGVLAVYRIKNNSALRRMKRWPQSLETY